MLTARFGGGQIYPFRLLRAGGIHDRGDLGGFPGRTGQLDADFGAAAAKVKAEDKGCEMYDLYRSVENPNAFVLVESWASQEDLDAHGKSAAMAEVGKIGPYLDGRPTLYRYED